LQKIEKCVTSVFDPDPAKKGVGGVTGQTPRNTYNQQDPCGRYIKK
jgi:hypothetical protein